MLFIDVLGGVFSGAFFLVMFFIFNFYLHEKCLKRLHHSFATFTTCVKAPLLAPTAEPHAQALRVPVPCPSKASSASSSTSPSGKCRSSAILYSRWIDAALALMLICWFRPVTYRRPRLRTGATGLLDLTACRLGNPLSSATRSIAAGSTAVAGEVAGFASKSERSANGLVRGAVVMQPSRQRLRRAPYLQPDPAAGPPPH